jgi:hypothetical protein
MASLKEGRQKRANDRSRRNQTKARASGLVRIELFQALAKIVIVAARERPTRFAGVTCVTSSLALDAKNFGRASHRSRDQEDHHERGSRREKDLPAQRGAGSGSADAP